MSTKKENKQLTGFRLSKNNLDFIENTADSLGLNRTGALDMILTIVRKDKGLLLKLIQKALTRG